MRLYGLLILALFLAPVADTPENAAARRDMKNLEGVWVLVSGEEMGAKLPDKIVRTGRLIMAGDRHTLRIGDTTIDGTHKVNPSREIKAMDVMCTQGPYAGKTLLGIYKLHDDELTVCFAVPGRDRPTAFTTRSGTGSMLHVWRRLKK